MATHLENTARYLVEAVSAVPGESRTQTAHGLFRRLLSIGVPLYPLLALRGLVQLRRPSRSNRLGGLLIEDHSSAPIAATLERVDAWRMPEKRAPGRLMLASTLFRVLPEITAAYRHAEPKAAFDVQRVLKLLSAYVFWRAALQSDRPNVVAIVRTNNPRRLALGAAAAELGIPVLVWIVERQGNRQPSPYPVNAMFCWSRTQSDHAGSTGIAAARMPLPREPIRVIDPVSLRNGKMGMLLNARADSKRLYGFLEQLDRDHGIRQVQLRPHPGSKMTQFDLPKNAVLRDWREPLPDFLRSIGAAIAMTSSSITDALMHGVPVIYRRGLDDVEDEMTGLLAKGIITELRSDDDPVQCLTDHYHASEFDFASLGNEYTADPAEERDLLLRYLPQLAGT